MKVVVNRTYGGFKIPEKLVEPLGWFCVYFNGDEDDSDYNERTAPDLIEALEEMVQNGEKIWPLEIVEIPDGIEWYIEDYDGSETIHEKHRVW